MIKHILVMIIFMIKSMFNISVFWIVLKSWIEKCLLTVCLSISIWSRTRTWKCISLLRIDQSKIKALAERFDDKWIWQHFYYEFSNMRRCFNLSNGIQAKQAIKKKIQQKTRFTWCDDCCRLLIKAKTPKNAHVLLTCKMGWFSIRDAFHKSDLRWNCLI